MKYAADFWLGFVVGVLSVIFFIFAVSMHGCSDPISGDVSSLRKAREELVLPPGRPPLDSSLYNMDTFKDTL